MNLNESLKIRQVLASNLKAGIKGVMTQKELSDKLGISLRTITNISTAKHNCSLVLALRIANELNLTLNDLVKE